MTMTPSLTIPRQEERNNSFPLVGGRMGPSYPAHYKEQVGLSDTLQGIGPESPRLPRHVVDKSSGFSERNVPSDRPLGERSRRDGGEKKVMSAIIRLAAESDAEKMLAIYTPVVLDTAISFELEPPTVDDFKGRIRNTLKTTPWLVCDMAGEIAGYAYAGQYRPRPAYQW